MADTSYLKRGVEPYVRAKLGERFRTRFSSRQLTLVTRGRHEFDAVSEDLSVVASIKSASGKTSGGN